MSEEDKQCFRCGARRKVLMNMRIDDSNIRLCGNCCRDYVLFLEGYVVNTAVKCGDWKEAKE